MGDFWLWDISVLPAKAALGVLCVLGGFLDQCWGSTAEDAEDAEEECVSNSKRLVASGGNVVSRLLDELIQFPVLKSSSIC